MQTKQLVTNNGNDGYITILSCWTC